MQLKRRVIMVGATFFLAAATGHLMQNGTDLIGGVQGVTPAPVPQRVAVLDAAAEIDEKTVTPLAGVADAGIAPGAVIRLAPKIQMMPKTATAVAPDCSPHLILSPAPAAMVDLSLNAPCNANARVVIRHSGLTITALTDAKGLMSANIPALAQAAHVTVALPGGLLAEGDITMPSLAEYDRVAVQWQGQDAFQLHAFEYGADYGDAGHVSAATPRTPSYALQARGGFMTMLGDATVPLPMLAQVYTFPSGRSHTAGLVRLTVEAEVAQGTCGREMLGETLEAHAGQPVKVVDLSLAMPPCTAMGDYVVLKNLLPDVTIAGN